MRPLAAMYQENAAHEEVYTGSYFCLSSHSIYMYGIKKRENLYFFRWKKIMIQLYIYIYNSIVENDLRCWLSILCLPRLRSVSGGGEVICSQCVSPSLCYLPSSSDLHNSNFLSLFPGCTAPVFRRLPRFVRQHKRFHGLRKPSPTAIHVARDSRASTLLVRPRSFLLNQSVCLVLNRSVCLVLNRSVCLVLN
jgi:hypothetical protein